MTKSKLGGEMITRLVFRKDRYTEEYLRGLGLNERQVKAVMYVKERGRITNKEYQKIAEVSKPTATRELARLVKVGVLKKSGVTGKGTFYHLGSEMVQRAHNGLKKGSISRHGGRRES